MSDPIHETSELRVERIGDRPEYRVTLSNGRSFLMRELRREGVRLSCSSTRARYAFSVLPHASNALTLLIQDHE